jgi:hypothetical protein
MHCTRPNHRRLRSGWATGRPSPAPAFPVALPQISIGCRSVSHYRFDALYQWSRQAGDRPEGVKTERYFSHRTAIAAGQP